MTYDHENFTMSFSQARDFRIDYRDFEKVARLPEGVELVAIAGVWGDYMNIRCLFADCNGNGYLRNIYRAPDEGYPIPELDLDAREIEVGKCYTIAAGKISKS